MCVSMPRRARPHLLFTISILTITKSKNHCCPGKPLGDCAKEAVFCVNKYSMLMAIETFSASAAFLSLYFLLHAQKKVPKKRAATAKRPHSRHARQPISSILNEKTVGGLAVASSHLPQPARPPLCRCINSRTYPPST